MSGGRSVGRVEGGCNNWRGRIDGEGNRGDGEGEGDEMRCLRRPLPGEELLPGLTDDQRG